MGVYKLTQATLRSVRVLSVDLTVSLSITFSLLPCHGVLGCVNMFE